MSVDRKQWAAWSLSACVPLNSTASPLEEEGNVLLQRTFLPSSSHLACFPFGPCNTFHRGDIGSNVKPAFIEKSAASHGGEEEVLSTSKH